MSLLFWLYIVLLAAASLLLQELMPTFSWLENSTVLLLPVLMFVSASMVPFPVMLVFALGFGFVWDLSELVVIPQGESLELGVSVVLFALFGAVMQGVRPMFQRGRWEVPLLMSGVVFFLYLLSSYSVICLRQGNFEYPPAIWLKLGLTTMMSLLAAPMLFYLLYRLAAWCGSPLDDPSLGKR